MSQFINCESAEILPVSQQILITEVLMPYGSGSIHRSTDTDNFPDTSLCVFRSISVQSLISQSIGCDVMMNTVIYLPVSVYSPHLTLTSPIMHLGCICCVKCDFRAEGKHGFNLLREVAVCLLSPGGSVIVLSCPTLSLALECIAQVSICTVN